MGDEAQIAKCSGSCAVVERRVARWNQVKPGLMEPAMMIHVPPPVEPDR